MPEGSRPLFTNWRTGKQLPIVQGIGTASVTTGQITGSIVGLIGTASITAEQIPTISSLLDSITDATAQGSILYRDSSLWVALPPGQLGQILQTNSASANPSWVSTNVTLAEGVITTTTQTVVLATSIPQYFSKIQVQLSSIAFTSGSAGFAIQVGVSAFDATVGNYFVLNFAGALGFASIFGPLVLATGSQANATFTIDNYQTNKYPVAFGFIHLIGGTGNVFWGSYRASTGVTGLRMITTASTSSLFNAGSYRVIGVR